MDQNQVNIDQNQVNIDQNEVKIDQTEVKIDQNEVNIDQTEVKKSFILDKTKIVNSILLVVLISGNIFFSIQYTENLKQQQIQREESIGTNIQVSRFLKLFVDVVLNTDVGQTISYNDRVKLENDIREIKDVDIINSWDKFVESADAKTAQKNAASLMKILTNKLLVD
jgi:hypothetical protein